MHIFPTVSYPRFDFVNRYKKKEDERQISIKNLNCVPYLGGNTSIKDMVDHSQSSGSGSGLPLLVSYLQLKYLYISKFFTVCER